MLLEVKQSIPQALASGESLVSSRQYHRFLTLHRMDTAIVDVPWNGWFQAFAIGQMADAFERRWCRITTTATSRICTHFCAALPNLRIMEIDIDDGRGKAPL